MATMVYYEGVWEYDNKTHIFRTPDGEPIFVTSFENCVATIDPLVGSHIKKVARIVAGCFDKKSNFKELLMIAFSEYHNEELKAIQFKFNDINIVVTKENANEEELKEILSSFDIPYDEEVCDESMERLFVNKLRRQMK